MAMQNPSPPQQQFQTRPIFPRQPIQMQPRPANQQFFTNRQVFGPPVNVFSRENSHKPTEKPTPMSTTSRIPSLQSRNFNRNQANPHRNPYTFTEITNLDDFSYHENQIYENPEYEYYNNYTNYPQNDPYYYTQDDFSNEPFVNNQDFPEEYLTNESTLEANQIGENQNENFCHPASENKPN